jgi:hypothetical protein
MAGKQVVGEPKIWVMFLLEESLPCVQPLLYLVWKKSSVILHGSTVIIVCFFGMKQNREEVENTQNLFFIRALKFQRLGRLGTNHTV